jgi:GMP synthase-like glutamine amidotransferase
MLAEAFAAEGFAIETLHIAAHEPGSVPFPDPRNFRVVVSLGAAAAAYDPAVVSSWGAAQMQLLRDADDAGVPVLGVCFGGQLIAQAHGGNVQPSERPEIGWYTVNTDDADLIPEGPWFEWHYDRWTVPPGAIEIARTPHASQSFILRRSLAVQFHPELDIDLLTTWLEHLGAPRLEGRPVNNDRLLQQTEKEKDAAALRVRRLVRAFLARTGAQRRH